LETAGLEGRLLVRTVIRLLPAWVLSASLLVRPALAESVDAEPPGAASPDIWAPDAEPADARLADAGSPDAEPLPAPRAAPAVPPPEGTPPAPSPAAQTAPRAGRPGLEPPRKIPVPLPASAGSGGPDLGGFIGSKFGFLPLLIPITEPAVGYGAAAGLAFIKQSAKKDPSELDRPNITFVGGMATTNGSWGAAVGDIRYWLGERLQTVAGLVYASVNLDYYGIGKDIRLENAPLRYNLQPTGGTVQAKARVGSTALWAGLSYLFARTQISFDAPAGTPDRPAFLPTMDVGGITAVLTLDTRDNIFTPIRGTFLEGSFGLFAPALGGSNLFERADLIAIQYVPLPGRLFFGVRGEAAASFGDTPFFMQPYIALRGVPIMRFQGEEMAEVEAELRWQFWWRVSLVGFAGAGLAWTQLERFDLRQDVISGGGGLRYELARSLGMHIGFDVATSRATTAFYIQVGSAWFRP
jgi:hypothetical protein